MIHPDAVEAAIRVVRAEEAWEPVLFGGLIPILGAGAIFWLIRYAIKEPPGEEWEDPHAEERLGDEAPPEDKKEGESEDPPSGAG